MRKTKIFRELLACDETIMAPAVYDCLSAMIAEQVGFKALFMSGLCLNIATKGLPDIGTETRTESIHLARNISGSVGIPVFVDAADGYGGPVGIYQTVRGLESAGAAGCFIEDQTFPPKCPLLGPPDVIPMDKFILKLRAALEAREDKDFVIIARTDSAATLGVEEAIRRGRACLEAGADVVLPAAGTPRDKEGLRQYVRAVGGPIMTPPAYHLGLTLEDYEEIGVKIVSGLEVILAAAKAIQGVLLELNSTGMVEEEEYHSKAISALGTLLGWGKWLEMDKKFQIVPG
jgi:2-methylisocitrate lyase-like PEP mutase family enzyme